MAVLIIFPAILQTVISLRMLPIKGEGVLEAWDLPMLNCSSCSKQQNMKYKKLQNKKMLNV